MAFTFRRRDRNQFKHIAHGLIPAATVAPRSAVPRTPPPRSPNPSPERPRSALAAAILMTSLTGRIVAMPQPRQRSYSENDSTHVEENSIIEPYATARDLGVEHNWKEYAHRKSVTSPDMSYRFEDQDTDNEMSDIEGEHVLHISERKDESISNVPIYAIPRKEKKKNLPETVAIVDDLSEMSSDQPDLENVPKMLNPVTPQECKIDSPAVSPVPRADTETSRKSPRRKQTTKVMKSDERNTTDQELSRDEIEQVKTRNQYLTDENQELAIQLQELKQQIKSLRTQLKNLKKEKRGLEESWKKQHKEADAAELISLRGEAQELVDENDALKMTVHRLNVELSRYQTKYRPLAKEEEEMKHFKTRVKEVIVENEQLHQQLEENKHITTKEWQLMQTQAKLVLEENQVLMKQFEVQHEKGKDGHHRHVQEVSRLTKQLMGLEAKQEELLEIQKQQEALRSKYDELKANMDGRVAVEEHVAMVNELKSQLQQERNKRKTEVEDMMDRMAALQAQKKSLLLERNDLIADNKTLEAEVEMVKKSNRKSQKKIGLLKQQVEDAMEKEVAAHQYLANLITLSESIAEERDHLIYLAKGLEAEKHGVLKKMMQGNIRLGRLEEKVKVYKKTAAGKLEGISHRLTEQEEDFAGKAAQYQREMKHLQRLLQDRQETLDEVLQQKRQVEGELEVVWESTSHENKEMKELLHKALKHNQWNACNSSGVFQYDSVHEYGFSYCDVNSASHAIEPTKQEHLS
ncbi:centrosomal protein of 89 kDa isoform X4 [Ascaphus truei]|uniref:centrosomal protein of 89 kDa isoform X4 n=1 Tax=Ascaphus truei TaxID=8439 RepID=UPI003F594DDE